MVRIKERYLLVNIIYPPERSKPSAGLPACVVYHQPTSSTLTPGALLKGLRAEVAALFGDYGSGSIESGLSIKYLSLATSTFILRVSRDHHRLVWAALTCMDRVPSRDGKEGKRCIFRVVRVSGTIRKAEEEAILNARAIHRRASGGDSAQALPPSALVVASRDRPQQRRDVLHVEDDDDDDDDMGDLSDG